MPPPLFQVIAQIATDDFGLLERVEKGLSRTFSLDLNPYRSQLRTGGVCVARASTLPEAEEKAQVARGIGADYRIVDPQGRTVRQGFGRRGDAPSAPRRDDPPTLLGGFSAPGGPPQSPRPPSGVHAPVRPSQENPALARTMMGPGGVGGEEGPTAEFERPDHPSEELEVLAPKPAPRAAPPPAAAAPGFNLDSLDADDLVLLDGSSEEQPKARPASALAPQSSAAELAFAPPSADDDLELEEELAAPPPAKVRVSVPAEPPELEPVAPLDDVPELSALADQAVTAERPAPPPAASAPRPPRASGQHGSARRTSSAAALSAPPGRLLLGGFLRARPRLRIILGFALALGLGGIVPACHARSVMSSRVTPQLEDLSTAKAHGHILSRLPNYRSPEAIEQEISSIKTRAGVLSVILWLLIGGGLAFAWFRFT